MCFLSYLTPQENPGPLVFKYRLASTRRVFREAINKNRWYFQASQEKGWGKKKKKQNTKPNPPGSGSRESFSAHWRERPENGSTEALPLKSGEWLVNTCLLEVRQETRKVIKSSTYWNKQHGLWQFSPPSQA